MSGQRSTVLDASDDVVRWMRKGMQAVVEEANPLHITSRARLLKTAFRDCSLAETHASPTAINRTEITASWLCRSLRSVINASTSCIAEMLSIGCSGPPGVLSGPLTRQHPIVPLDRLFRSLLIPMPRMCSFVVACGSWTIVRHCSVFNLKRHNDLHYSSAFERQLSSVHG